MAEPLPPTRARLRWRPYAAGLLTGVLLGVAVLAVLQLRGPGRKPDGATNAAAPGREHSAEVLRQSRTTAIVTAVDMTRRAVVTIRAAGPVAVKSPMLDLFRWPASRPRTVDREWVGSGFLLDRDGFIVTMAHVVQGATD